MLEPETQAALQVAACLAFRHIDEVSLAEREQVLIALVEVLPEGEAAIANEALFHLRAQRKAQLELGLVIEARRSGEKKN